MHVWDLEHFIIHTHFYNLLELISAKYRAWTLDSRSLFLEEQEFLWKHKKGLFLRNGSCFEVPRKNEKIQIAFLSNLSSSVD